MVEGVCHFCGEPTPCECMKKCARCPHIGHEHSADGSCRGTNYDTPPPYKTDPCNPHQYEAEGSMKVVLNCPYCNEQGRSTLPPTDMAPRGVSFTFSHSCPETWILDTEVL